MICTGLPIISVQTRFSLTTASKIFDYPSSKRPVALLSLPFPHMTGVIMRILRPISTQGVRVIHVYLSSNQPSNTNKCKEEICSVCLLQKNSCTSRIPVQFVALFKESAPAVSIAQQRVEAITGRYVMYGNSFEMRYPYIYLR